MYEMTAAELDAELAVELPDRALMKKMKNNKVNISHSVIVNAFQQNNSQIDQQAYGGYANGGNGGKVDVEKAAKFSASANGGNGGDASANNFAQVDQQNVIWVSNN